MKRIALVLLLFALLPCMSRAQTTYTLNNDFRCDAASVQPDYPFSLFSCRGAKFYNASGNYTFELFFYSGAITIFTPTGTVFAHGTYSNTGYLEPSPEGCGSSANPCTTDGTFSFRWSGADLNGNPHNGTVSGSWTTRQECCKAWYYPFLRSGTVLVVNQ